MAARHAVHRALSITTEPYPLETAGAHSEPFPNHAGHVGRYRFVSLENEDASRGRPGCVVVEDLRRGARGGRLSVDSWGSCSSSSRRGRGSSGSRLGPKWAPLGRCTDEGLILGRKMVQVCPAERTAVASVMPSSPPTDSSPRRGRPQKGRPCSSTWLGTSGEAERGHLTRNDATRHFMSSHRNNLSCCPFQSVVEASPICRGPRLSGPLVQRGAVELPENRRQIAPCCTTLHEWPFRTDF